MNMWVHIDHCAGTEDPLDRSYDSALQDLSSVGLLTAPISLVEPTDCRWPSLYFSSVVYEGAELWVHP